MNLDFNYKEDRLNEKPSKLFTSTLLDPYNCLYEQNTRFTEESFQSFSTLLKSIEGIASVILRDDYSARVKIGHLFFPTDVHNKVKKALNI